jgi:TetR/AcrR family transcriptional regulator, cholesterol catabolism regulator
VALTDRAAGTALGRRERKKLATRDRIFECAVALFASRGYDATTMEDIGDSADVARATVFNYFSRKEDLVDEWFVRRGAEVAEILAEAEQETTDTSNRLRQAFRVVASFYEDDPTTGRAIMRASLSSGGPLRAYTSASPDRLADTLRLGQQRGDISPDVDPVRAGLLIFDGYLGVVYRWVSDEDGGYALEENLMAMLDLILAGIARERPAEGSRKSRRTTAPAGS